MKTHVMHIHFKLKCNLTPSGEKDVADRVKRALPITHIVDSMREQLKQNGLDQYVAVELEE